MAEWSFLTNHARALVCIAHDPGVRLRDIAAQLDITERSAYAIVTELVDAGYVVKQKDGRRNRYEIQGHLPLRGSVGRERTIGEVLDLLVQASVEGDPDALTQQSDAAHRAPDRPWWRRSAEASPSS
jgi:DNA-binding transcriptional ArsR family regulator